MASENVTSLLKALERNGLKTLSDPEHLNADPEGSGRGKGWYVTLETPNGPETVNLGLTTEIAVATAMGRKKGGLVGVRNPARVPSTARRVAAIGLPVLVGGAQGALDGYLTEQGHTGAADLAQLGTATVGLLAAWRSSNPHVRQAGITAAAVSSALEARRHVGPAISRWQDDRKRRATDAAVEADWLEYQRLMNGHKSEEPAEAPEETPQEAKAPAASLV